MQEHSVDRHMASRIVVLLIMVIVASTMGAVNTLPVHAQSGRFIDLFTQRGGMGVNQSSDMFQPQELVVLYALVTYNDNPVALKDVAYQVDGPPNALANVTEAGSSRTNGSGIAEWSFRIPWPSEDPEKIIFGEWHVLARVDVADESVEDTMTFQVGWIIKITRIATLDIELKPAFSFLRENTIVFNLTVENNAETAKPATITVDAQDSASHPIIHIHLDSLVLQPGVNYVNASAIIPADAALGMATVYAAPYTAPIEQGGILYSPAISTTFEVITVSEQTHDVAIMDVRASPSVAYVGDDIGIIVEAANMGNYAENFNVTVYYNDFILFIKQVNSLLPNQTTTIESTWHTSSVGAGTYRIRALAEVVPGEVNTANNVFIDGYIVLLSKSPQGLPSSFPLLIILMFFLVLVASLVFVMLLIMLSYMRRRKKRLRRSYGIIVHPHI